MHIKLQNKKARYAMSLTEKQFKAVQIILGIVTGAVIWFTIWIAVQYPDNQVLGYLFLGVFLAALLIQRRVEKKIGKPLKYYFRAYLISLAGGLGAFLIYGFSTGQSFFGS